MKARRLGRALAVLLGCAIDAMALGFSWLAICAVLVGIYVGLHYEITGRPW